MKNPWKKLTSHEIYKNKWIRLREDKVITPSGSKGIYGVIETKPAIGIVPLTTNMNTFLVGQYRYTLDRYSWEIPEGGGIDGESTLMAAKRELLEETGLNANKWTFLDTMFTSNSFTDEIASLYLAEELEQGEAKPDETEELIVKRLPFKEALQMVINYEIKDSMAIIGILRCYQYLKNSGRIDY